MQMSIFLKNAFTVVIHCLYMKMEQLIYFLKLKIKESNGKKILKAIPDFGQCFRHRKHASRAGNVSGAGSWTGLLEWLFMAIKKNDISISSTKSENHLTSKISNCNEWIFTLTKSEISTF